MKQRQELIEKYSNVITDRLLLILESYTDGEIVIEKNEDKIVVRQVLNKYLELMLSEIENNG